MGGVYGDNVIPQKRISDKTSDLNEWSHSRTVSKPPKNQELKTINVDDETRPMCWKKKKLAVTGCLEVTMNTKIEKRNGMA